MRNRIMILAAVAGLVQTAAGETPSRRALQQVYIEPVAVAARVARPPTLDGSLTDKAWKSAEALDMGYSDPTSPGMPRNVTKVYVVCDKANLYLGFDCKELQGVTAKVTRNNDEKLPTDDHVGIVLLAAGNRWTDSKHANVTVQVKVNAKGATWARRYAWLEGDARPGKPIEIAGLAAAAKTYAGRWAVEVKVPLAGLFADLSKMPAVWKVNFLRKRHARLYSSVKPGDPGYANWTLSWKPSAYLATLCLDPSMFGILYVPEGRVVPEKVRNLGPTMPDVQVAQGTPDPPPGFKLSQAELQKLLGGPVAFVRHVDRAPVLRGDMSDPLWQKAEPVVLRYLDVFTPGEVEKNRTYVRVLADAKNLYVAFDCEEDFMQEIRAERDGVDPAGLWLEDCIDVLLDPGRTESYRYFYIGANVKGAHTKRRFKNDIAWRPRSLTFKTFRGQKRWRLEMKVSFADLGVKPGRLPKLWGGNFFRGRWARRPNMMDTPGWANWDMAWRPNPIGTAHVPEFFGFLYFQAGDVVHPKLAAYMKSKGMDLAGMGLRVQTPAVEKPGPDEPARKPAAFDGKLRARRSGRKVTVRFAAKAATDAAVWVTDAKGKVVRHLAGGVLGPKAPEPFKPGRLAQALTWDGKDDRGKALPAGTYKVHVGLGLNPRFERIIGWRPGVGTIRSLAVAPGGKLYVFTGGASVDHGWANSSICVYDRGGRYLKQVYPFPGNLSIGQMAGIRPIALADGRWTPIVYQALNHSWLPESPAIGTQQTALTADGHIIMTNMPMRGMGQGRRLMKIGLDGSCPADMLGPHITRYAVGGEMYVALSPDGKYAYVTGLRGRSLWDPGEHHDCVYRVAWGDAGPARPIRKPFIGELQRPGSDARHLSNPRGIAVDGKGNIIVADTGNGRLAVFRPDGSPLKQIPMRGADKVAVNRRSGAVYVLCSKVAGRARGVELVKLKDLAGAAEVARLKLPKWGRSAMAMAVDAEASPALIWLGSGDKVADTGEGLLVKGNLHKDATGPFDDKSVSFAGNLMYVDPATDTIYAGKYRLFDGKTGKYIKDMRLRAKGRIDWGGEIAIGPDRNFYLAGNNALLKFSPQGTPLPFADGKLEVPRLFGGHGNSNRGHCIGPNGDVYFVHHYHGHGNTQVCVSRVSPEGKVKQYQFINNRYASGSGIRVDRKGNVYVGMAVKPADTHYPAWYRGRLPEHVTYPAPWFFYRQMYGSIVKFGPAGGKVIRDVAGDYHATNYSYFHRCRIEGAQWAHFGYSPMHQKDVESSRCNCESARFDLDGFGRLFIPDAMRATVDVIDANANRVTRIGGYGNMDARGPGSPCPEPAIAMAWPLVVSATDTACYIADTINRRILKAALDYHARQAVDVKLP